METEITGVKRKIQGLFENVCLQIGTAVVMKREPALSLQDPTLLEVVDWHQGTT
jgi:hypothetical protein